jgi:hypothetical protein
LPHPRRGPIAAGSVGSPVDANATGDLDVLGDVAILKSAIARRISVDRGAELYSLAGVL